MLLRVGNSCSNLPDTNCVTLQTTQTALFANLSSSFSSSLQNIGFYNNPIFWVTCTVQYESAVCEYHREQSVKWSFNTFSTFLWLDKTMNVNVDIKSSDKPNTQKLSANSRKSIKDFILFADRMCHRPPLCWRSRRFYQ